MPERPPQRDRTLKVRVPKDLLAAVKDAADRDDLSVAQFTRRALWHWLEMRELAERHYA
ncbi:MAG: hypothetical protein KGL39_29920 [Patescibacteria group bacterium]|nr:hypothetical protein [Patescibacteria group bacterium]